MRDAAAVDLLHRMVEIDSPSGDERWLAEFLGKTMAAEGFAVRLDEVGNVIGSTGTGGPPTVLLAGHLDTAGAPVDVRRDAGRLYGRGASDAKGPLATFVAAAARHGTRFPGTLIVAGVVEEETPGSRGAVHLAGTLPPPAALLVGEPGGWAGITVGYKGKLDLAYRVRRPAAHPASPAERASEVAAEFWCGVRRMAGDGHAAFDRIGATLCEVRADLESAELALCVRLPPGVSAGRVLELLRPLARDAELNVVASVDAVVVDRRSPVVRALRAAIRHAGGTPRLTLKSGTGDMNEFAARWSVPMATYGPGDNRLDHTPAEHIEIDDYLRAVDVLTHALQDLARSVP